jgi:hypothetical protein
MNSYRVHYKKGDIEVEVESTDKGYVDQMLQKFLSPQAVQTSLPGLPKQKRKPLQTGRRQTQDKEAAANEQETTIDYAAVANAVHESDRTEDIQKNVLDKRDSLGRILAAFHFAHETGNEYLTTGDVEKITDQLRVKISQPNASRCVAANRKYFSAQTSRRRGAKVPYKLNRQGEIAYEKCLTGQKVK